MTPTRQNQLQANISAAFKDPSTLTVPELKAFLRERGLPVTGRKVDLLERLVLSHDDSDSISHPLRIIPFDGKGLDPANLIGLRVSHFTHDMAELVLHCTNKATVTIDSQGSTFSRYEQIKVDENLISALAAAVPEVDLYGDLESAPATRKEGGLLITEAAVGVRKYNGPHGEYRVVGIKCEGMEEMGWVFSEDEEMDDQGLDLPLSEIQKFGDVAVNFGEGMGFQ